MRYPALVLAIAAALLAPAAALPTPQQAVNKDAAYIFMVDVAQQQGVPTGSFDIKVENGGKVVYWVDRFGHSKWEKMGFVVYGTENALATVFDAALAGWLNPNDWPKIAKERYAVGPYTGLAELISLQLKDGGWGWKRVGTEGTVFFPGGMGETLRTAQILARDLIPAVRLGITEVQLNGTTYSVIDSAKAAIRFLLDQQLPSGGYSANRNWSQKPDPLYTGWALIGLVEAYKYRDLLHLDQTTVSQIEDAIRKAVQWLLQDQNKQDHLWHMKAAAVMGSETAPPSEAEIVIGLLDAYTVADQLGLDKQALADAIESALAAIVPDTSEVITVDGRKVVTWGYCIPETNVEFTAKVVEALALANELGLADKALSELESDGASLQNEEYWLLKEFHEKDGYGYWLLTFGMGGRAAVSSVQLYATEALIALEKPNVILGTTTGHLPKVTGVPTIGTVAPTGNLVLGALVFDVVPVVLGLSTVGVLPGIGDLQVNGVEVKDISDPVLKYGWFVNAIVNPIAASIMSSEPNTAAGLSAGTFLAPVIDLALRLAGMSSIAEEAAIGTAALLTILGILADNGVQAVEALVTPITSTIETLYASLANLL